MSEHDPMLKGDAGFDRLLTGMLDAAAERMPQFIDICRRLQATAQRGNGFGKITIDDAEWLIRLAHLGAAVVNAKLLERTVLE